MTLGAVIDRPYFIKAIFVALRMIFDAKTGPNSKFHNEQTAVTPANISPTPPHRFLPP
jgi:hypothetical protein